MEFESKQVKEQSFFTVTGIPKPTQVENQSSEKAAPKTMKEFRDE